MGADREGTPGALGDRDFSFHHNHAPGMGGPGEYQHFVGRGGPRLKALRV